MRRHGGGGSSAPLSPTSHTIACLPEWWSTLFPARSHSDAADDDEDATTPPFHSAEDARRFLALQRVQLQLLQRIRATLSGTEAGSANARHKYARMELDVRLLESSACLFDFAVSASERVHQCSPAEMRELQANNLHLLIAILHVIRGMMASEELRVTGLDGRAAAATTAPPDVNVADRMCAHNAAEVWLTIIEPFVAEICDAPSDSDCAEMHALHSSLLEGALRCLHTMLQQVSDESPHRIDAIKQMYLHIPPAQPQPPFMAGAARASDSELLCWLIKLVARKSNPLTALSAGILSFIAATPVPNAHIHSTATCGNLEHAVVTAPLCTRATPSAAVITFPPHHNSTLAIAAKLFSFPAQPVLYLIERGLLGEYLELMRPFLPQPLPLERDHSHAHGRTRSMSLRDGTSGMEDGNDILAGFTLPASSFQPAGPLRCAHLFTHASRAPSNEHHASFALTEDRFMDAQYRTSKEETSSEHEQVDAAPPLLPQPEREQQSAPAAPAFALPRHLSAPLHESNELLAAALGGLACLASRSPATSAYLCSQQGLLSFLARCVLHPQLQLSLRAVEMIAAMERALACAITHAHSCSSPHSDSLTGDSIAQLSCRALRPRTHSRRNSESGPSVHRRNSRETSGSSPHAMSSSPPQLGKYAHSPRHFSLSWPAHAAPAAHPPSVAPTLGASDAHALLAPLVSRSLQLLLELMKQQWSGDGATKRMDDARMQRQAADLLATIVGHSESYAAECAAVIPLLAKVLADRSIHSLLRCSLLRCLAALCTHSAPNRRAVLKSGVMTDVGALLHALQAMHSTRPLHERTRQLMHSTALNLQLVALQLCTHLADGSSSSPALRLFDPSSDSTATTILHLLSFLDSPHLRLCVATVRCLANLLLPHSSVRDMLEQARVMPKLVRCLHADAEAWQATGHSFDLEDMEGAEHALSLTLQLRLHALRALSNLIATAPLALKRSVFAELGSDRLFALLSPSEDESNESPIDATSVPHATSLLLDDAAWILARHLLQPSSDVGSEERNTAAAVLMDAHQVARVLDLLIARAARDPTASHPSCEHVQLLASIAARTDRDSKALICARPALLSLLDAAIQQQGEGAQWASNCLFNLLQPTAAEQAAMAPGATLNPVAADIRAPLDTRAARVQLLLEHDSIVPHLLVLLRQPREDSQAATLQPPIRALLRTCVHLMCDALARQCSDGGPPLRVEQQRLLEELAAACKSDEAASAVAAPPRQSDSALEDSRWCECDERFLARLFDGAHSFALASTDEDTTSAPASGSSSSAARSLSASPGIEELDPTERLELGDEDAAALQPVRPPDWLTRWANELRADMQDIEEGVEQEAATAARSRPPHRQDSHSVAARETLRTETVADALAGMAAFLHQARLLLLEIARQ